MKIRPLGDKVLVQRLEAETKTAGGIVLRLRNPEESQIRSMRVNGKRHSDFEKATGLVRLKPAGHTLNLEVFFR